MAFRVVMIENNVTLSVKLNNLIVNMKEGDLWINRSNMVGMNSLKWVNRIEMQYITGENML